MNRPLHGTPASIPPIRITDWSNPEFSPEVAAMFSGAADFAAMLPLEPDAIMAMAVDQLGGALTDFGADEFREPLALMCRVLKQEAGLSGMGHVSLHTQFVGFMKNRLLLQDLLTRHPEIRDIPIERPIFIVGQPRTGTTHLHNLLSADPALRSMQYWESQQPIPLPGEADLDPDPRRARCQGGIDFLDAALPHFQRMHEMTVDHVHEEIQLLANSCCTMLFDTMAPIPSWRDWYRAHDHIAHYEHLKLWLQAMTFLRGGERWVLKSPQHLEQLATIDRVFPDSFVVVTHRDPVNVTISMMTMLAYTQRLQLQRPDPRRVAEIWTGINGEMLDTCMATRDVIPPERSFDLRFTEFMADDLATVRRIYALAGQPYNERAQAAHAGYLAHHQRDRFGKVIYDFEPFGVDPARLRARFEPYVERFGLVREWQI